MQVLSIQSQVCAGRVGNSAASFPLESAGLDVIGIPTALLSNHPGHGGFTGHLLPGEEVDDLLQGVMQHIEPQNCAAVLSGYLGTAKTADSVRDAVETIKAANPAALYCCDPVVGDHPVGLYVAEDIVKAFPAKLFSLADILTPNAFELAYFSGQAPTTIAEACQAAKRLQALGPQTILCTSLAVEETPAGKLDALLYLPQGAYIIRVERLTGATSGAGDLLTALFLASILNGEAALDACAKAMATTTATIATAAANGLTDLPPPDLKQVYPLPEIIRCE